jgi:Xaa-Pro aminopeptidase
MKKIHPVDLSSLTPMEVSLRIPRLLGKLSDSSLDAVIITNLTNVRYLTSFTGSAAILAVKKTGESCIFTDGRYELQVQRELQCSSVDIQIEVGSPKIQSKQLVKFVKNCKRIGLEGQNIPWDSVSKMAKLFEGSDIVSAGTPVEELRVIKDLGEVARIEKACQCADVAFKNIRNLFIPGVSELDLTVQLDFEIRLCGASGNSFSTIVASGPNGALPHAKPTDRKFVEGDLIVCDFGSQVDGYCSDMTRTVSVGEPNKKLKEIYDIVLSAQVLGVNSVKSGVTTTKVDNACRKFISDSGFKDKFTHSTGHGVGLDIHELPWVASSFSTKLKENMVITVEPGIYIEDLGGVRIEDTLVVTTDGSRTLTNTTKDMVA